MASDALFQMLAQAKGQPDRWARDVNQVGQSGEEILGGYLRGKQIRSASDEAALKPYEIWSKISDSAGPDVANNIFKQRGIPVPDMGQTSSVQETPEQLVNKGKYGERKLGAQEKALTLTNNAPFEPDVATAIGAGDIASLVKIHQAKGEPVPYREMQQAISAKTGGQRGGFYDARAGTMQLSQLPSQLPSGTIPGAAAGVKMSARQGKSLIAKATSPQNLKLASVDLTRAVARMAPDAATIGQSDYGNSLPTMLGRLTQLLDSDPASPDVPKLRKQIYDTLDELDKSATPFIMNHLQNMEANGTNSTFGNNWNATKQRELGANIPEIPFDAGISTGVQTPGGGGWSYVGPVK